MVRCRPDEVADRVREGLADAARVVVPAGFPDAWLPDGIDRVGDDPPLTAYDLDELDAVVTTAALGIAVTGTIVLDHGPGQGRRALSLVPDRHVCVVSADQVVADVPDAVRRLDPVRPLTWISGPSATSDIELDRVEGVHGPSNLHVIVVDSTRPLTPLPPGSAYESSRLAARDTVKPRRLAVEPSPEVDHGFPQARPDVNPAAAPTPPRSKPWTTG